MKKNKKKSKQLQSEGPLKPEQALQFLEDIRQLSNGVDEPTQIISIRIPANILRTTKLKAKFEGKKYQSLIVDYIRKGLAENR